MSGNDFEPSVIGGTGTGTKSAPAEKSELSLAYTSCGGIAVRTVGELEAASAELKVSQRTVKRDLDALRAAGRITFVGPARTGHYRMK